GPCPPQSPDSGAASRAGPPPAPPGPWQHPRRRRRRKTMKADPDGGRRGTRDSGSEDGSRLLPSADPLSRVPRRPPSVDALARQVAERLLARGEKVAVAETSAGGLINHALTDIAGSSKWYLGGAVPYTTNAKAALCGLDPAAIEAEGSVSAYTAREMARGI